jgi:hypothetical protein
MNLLRLSGVLPGPILKARATGGNFLGSTLMTKGFWA